jgi:hypothetical protein
MSSQDSSKEAIIEFLGVDDYKEIWKSVKEDLHARVLSNN